MIVSLTGFMGCGKSSVGRKLSELLCCRFLDLDDAIVERERRSIPEIFATDGEAEFRRIEKDILNNIIDSYGKTQNKISEINADVILALGGGAVMQEECERMVHEGTLCIYLKASVDTLLRHLESQATGRPLLNMESSLRERILDMMDKRAATYERTAHHIIETDGKAIEEIAAEIIDLLTPSTQGRE